MKCNNCNKDNPKDSKFCQYCGYEFIEKNTDNENKSEIYDSKSIKKVNSRIIIISLLLFCLALIGLNVLQLFARNNDSKTHKEIVINNEAKIDKLYREIDNMKRDNDSIKMKLNIQADKLNFFDNSVVFVIEGYGRNYYSYDRMMEIVGNNKFTYWAYNVELARYEGFRPGN